MHYRLAMCCGGYGQPAHEFRDQTTDFLDEIARGSEDREAWHCAVIGVLRSPSWFLESSKSILRCEEIHPPYRHSLWFDLNELVSVAMKHGLDLAVLPGVLTPEDEWGKVECSIHSSRASAQAISQCKRLLRVVFEEHDASGGRAAIAAMMAEELAYASLTAAKMAGIRKGLRHSFLGEQDTLKRLGEMRGSLGEKFRDSRAEDRRALVELFGKFEQSSARALSGSSRYR